MLTLGAASGVSRKASGISSPEVDGVSCGFSENPALSKSQLLRLFNIHNRL
jgi:hypothetical protein